MDILTNWDTRLLNLMCLEASEGGGGGNNEEPPKTFTQEEVNRIVASEKHKNQNSVYKDLGFEDSETAKAFIEKYKAQEESEKDELTKAQEKAAELEAQKEAEAEKTKMVEYKFKVVEEGCDPKNAADIVTLVVSKMSDDKDFDDAFEDVKKAYPSMFESSNSSGGGTGSGGNPPRPNKKGGETSGLGKRLAEQRKNGSKKTSFFQN